MVRYIDRNTKGRAVSKIEAVRDATIESGTAITFMPDKGIFDETVFNYETLEYRFRELSFLNKVIKITFEDKKRRTWKGKDIPLYRWVGWIYKVFKQN